MKTTSFDINVLRATKWDFAKAEKLQKARSKMDKDEFNYLIEVCEASNELAVGEVNKERLTKILKHVNKNRKQYTTLACLTIFIISSGALSYALPTMSTMAMKSTMVASTTMPSFQLSTATTMVNKLIGNLIKLGVLATVASCVWEMLKSIIEGNVTKLPKTLITHSMMCCSVLLAPTVFNYISNVFNMGNIISIGQALSNILI